MRGLTRLATTSNCPTTTFSAAKQSLLSSSHSYSTFSGGSGGGGRGRGRGSSPPRFPGQTEPNAEADAFNPPPGLGHGRGQPVLPSSPVLPSFSSFISSPNPSSSAAAGRGRGRLSPSPATEIPDSSNPKKPIFFRREDSESGSKKTQFADPDESPSLSPPLPSISGAGRGKPVRPSPDSGAKPPEINRHLRPRTPIGSTTSTPTGAPLGPKLGREEAIKKAVEVLSRGGGGRGRGRGVMGRGRGRGRGRGGRGRDTGEEFDLYLGDNADGEKLEKRLGEENMKKLTEGFEELSWTVLPSPVEDAYLDALHTNNMV